jgi:hypothetical protein
MRKEFGGSCLGIAEVLSWRIPRGTEKNHRTTQLAWPKVYDRET